MRCRRLNWLRAAYQLSMLSGCLGIVFTGTGCGGDDKKQQLPADCCEQRGACTAPDSLDSRYESLWANDSCADDKVCVPHELSEVKTPATCHAASSGAEGRCLPACLASVTSRAAWVAQDDCEEHDRCVPCSDPIDGEDTGVCHLADDPGPSEDTALFASCCKDESRCVPEDAVQESGRSAYGQDSCDDGQLCVMADALHGGADYVPAKCSTALRGEGRCLPSCLPLIASQLPRLAQNDCRDGLLCAPCSDPGTGEPTGACTLGADKTPTGLAFTFAACCGDLGHCVPNGFVPEEQRGNLSRETCPSESALCVPDAFAASNFRPQTCTASAFAAEGRCLPGCLGALASQIDRLAQDGCPDQHVCAPCYDPITGKSTGSCDVGADSGPSTPPSTFAACCEGVGHCIPSSLVPDAQRSALNSESCDNAEALCVPDAFTSSDFVPNSCVSSVLGAEGRCLPACLGALKAQSDRLAQDSCDQGELCAPCFDPLNGESTGSCALGTDPGPKESPATFASCCGDIGHCIPATLVPESNRQSLAALTCRDEGALCVPDAFTQADFKPKACTASAFAAEGRCLPDCLPQLTGQAGLVRDDCSEHELCAPCYDPRTGAATGSCSLGSDKGPSGDPTLLATCCGGVGHCIPTSVVPEQNRASLAALTCEAADNLCVPDAFASADFVPTSCTTQDYGAEGRCLPSCLPQLAPQLSRLSQSNCAAQELCAPCYDPVSGAATGSCAIGRDPGPTQPATQFSTCCSGAGSCVPRSLVPDDQEAQLGVDACQEAERLCVPAEILSSAQYLPTKCTVAAIQAEGRCLPSCLPAVAARSTVLQQDDCPAEHRCAPCFDPLTGASTSACTFAGDPGPTGPAVTLTNCCGTQGRCTPRAWVPTEQSSQLGQDSCDPAQDQLCVAPAGLASDPKFVAASCADPRTGAEGRCLPACLPAVAGRASALVQASCAETDRCVPCFDPLSGTATGACNLGGDTGATSPPVVFGRCCGEGDAGAGLCVPASFLPEGTPALGAQSCTGESVSCVPADIATNTPLPTCSALGAKGACLDACFVQSLLQFLTPQGSCAEGKLCVSCEVLGTSVAGCGP